MRRLCTSCAFYDKSKSKLYAQVKADYHYDGWCCYWDEDRDSKENPCEYYKRRKYGWKPGEVSEID